MRKSQHILENDVLVSVKDDNSLPASFILYQNYPNPFNPSTKISWQSPVGSWQTLKVYDVLGNEVLTLLNEYKPEEDMMLNSIRYQVTDIRHPVYISIN